MELYIHIPFCVKKCNYCDFLSFPISEKKGIIELYIEALCEELRRYSGLLSCSGEKSVGNKSLSLDTIYIGGGTPSSMEPVLMERVLTIIRDSFDYDENTEFTIECNPGTLNKEKLALYRKYGINRLSIGLQSDNDKHLSELGRIHTYGRFLESYCMARNAGFENISIDLISAIPGQTIEEWKETLNSICMLEPEHISAYSLIIEEGTPLYDRYEKCPGSLCLPDEDEEREIYHVTKSILEEHGYTRYEISNYSKPGKYSRHNYGYWTGEKYYGAGLGASSYLDKAVFLILNNENKDAGQSDVCVRFKNTADMTEYIALYGLCDKLNNEKHNNEMHNNEKNNDKLLEKQEENYNAKMNETSGCLSHYREVEFLHREDMMSEYCILGLRTVRGLSKNDFRKKFSCELDDMYGEVIDKYVKMGFLKDKNDYVSMTDEGFDVSNAIMVDFM